MAVTAYENNVIALLGQWFAKLMIYPEIVRQESCKSGLTCAQQGKGACNHFRVTAPDPRAPLPLGIEHTEPPASKQTDTEWAAAHWKQYTKIDCINEARIQLVIGPLQQIVWSDVTRALDNFASALVRTQPPPPPLMRTLLGPRMALRIAPHNGDPALVALRLFVPRVTDAGELRVLAHDTEPAIAPKRAAEPEVVPAAFVIDPACRESLQHALEHADEMRVLACVNALGALQADGPDIELGVGAEQKNIYTLLFRGYEHLSRADMHTAASVDGAITNVCVWAAPGPALVLEIAMQKHSCITSAAACAT